MDVEFCGTWVAIHDRMPGKQSTLRVEGSCCFNTGGWTAELRDHDGPQGINPRVLILDLVVKRPQGAAIDVLTEVEVRWERETEASYDQVHVIVVGDDSGDRLLDVEEVT